MSTQTTLIYSYGDDKKEELTSPVYLGSAEFTVRCLLYRLITKMSTTYYNTKTEYTINECCMTDPLNSFKGCKNEDELEKEYEQMNQPVYEVSENGSKYRVIDLEPTLPHRTCWCFLIRELLRTGKGLCLVAPMYPSVHGTKYYAKISGFIEKTEANNILLAHNRLYELTAYLSIRFDYSYHSPSDKDKNKGQIVYYDEETKENMLLKMWRKYSLSSLNPTITVTKFPREFKFAIDDIGVRTTSLINCTYGGVIDLKHKCSTVSDCWCTALNGLRTKGAFKICVPLRIIYSKYLSENSYNFFVTIEGKINALDNTKIDMSFKPDYTCKIVYNNNNSAYYASRGGYYDN